MHSDHLSAADSPLEVGDEIDVAAAVHHDGRQRVSPRRRPERRRTGGHYCIAGVQPVLICESDTVGTFETLRVVSWTRSPWPEY